jgi:alkylhydroperoxidase/carboxymuconolactone decarboxylase family protein YurZ
MARPEEVKTAEKMKKAKTGKEMILSWGDQRPGADMEGTLKVLRLYVEKKPEMIATFAHNQLTQVTDRGILDAKTRYLVTLGIYMALRHCQGIGAQ